MRTKITEQSAIGQVASFASIIAAVILPLFAFALWAADLAADSKYATDADVLAVQTEVAEQVNRIKTLVEANTATVRDTVKSVDGLTLVVLDLQIGELEANIIQLEVIKRSEGAGWNEREETDLRNKQRALDNLDTQRTILFARVTAS